MPRPNILHIVTDQQRFDTIAELGNPFIRTPHLDRLVRESTAFTRAYTPSPECVPARSSMITGWYPGRAGCFSNAQPMPSPEKPTIMNRLRDAGYTTHGVGKCHFTPDPYAGYGFQTRDIQEELVRDRGKDDYARWLIDNGWDWILEPHGIRGEMYYIPQPSALPESAHPSRWVADRSIDFLRTQEAAEAPWYLYTGFIHPHPPFSPPIPWHKLYRARDMPLPDVPENADELVCHINRFQNRYKYRDRGLDLNLVRSLRAFYYACITFVDAQVGRILATLEATSQLDKTLILFTADHGEYLGDFGCFGKRGMHDVSARIPLVVRWPGAQHAGTRCDTPASLVDLAPTFMQAAEAGVRGEDFDGISLQSLRDGSSSRTTVFSQFDSGPNALYMAVNREEKYVYSAPDQREYLFDLRSDPREHINRVGADSAGNDLQRLRRLTQSWAASQGQGAEVEGERWLSHPRQQMPADPDAGLLIQDPPWWDGRLPAG
jgi:arylsulfatase